MDSHADVGTGRDILASSLSFLTGFYDCHLSQPILRLLHPDYSDSQKCLLDPDTPSGRHSQATI